MSGLTAHHIEKALRAAGAGDGLVAPAGKIADLFNSAILSYGGGQFSTSNRVAALVSECMMESAYFRTTEEFAKNGPYAPYIGRGFIQCTWKANYAAFGRWCKANGLLTDADHFVDNPKRLADLKWAALTGVWYFTEVKFHGKPLVAYAKHIDQVGKAVNLGDPFSAHTPNGAAARRAAFAAVKSVGKGIVPLELSPSTGNPESTSHIDIFPTAGQIQTPFGRRGPFWSWNRDKHGNGKHSGDDWHRNAGPSEEGDEIYAVADGRVIFAGSSKSQGWGPAFGNHVLITWSRKINSEDFHRTSIDAHMIKVAVTAGQQVSAGDVIGYKGATGNVSGVHDHHEQHAGEGWSDRRLKPIYPGKTITRTVKSEGVPIMVKPNKFRRKVDRVVEKSKFYKSIPITDDGKRYSCIVTKQPATAYVVANIVTDKDCWARIVTMTKQDTKAVYSTRYPRVWIKAGGDQIQWWDTIKPERDSTPTLVRIQILAYSRNVTVKDIQVRAGIEPDT